MENALEVVIKTEHFNVFINNKFQSHVFIFFLRMNFITSEKYSKLILLGLIIPYLFLGFCSNQHLWGDDEQEKSSLNFPKQSKVQVYPSDKTLSLSSNQSLSDSSDFQRCCGSNSEDKVFNVKSPSYFTFSNIQIIFLTLTFLMGAFFVLNNNKKPFYLTDPTFAYLNSLISQKILLRI